MKNNTKKRLEKKAQERYKILMLLYLGLLLYYILKETP
jgi:hypothetical protein